MKLFSSIIAFGFFTACTGSKDEDTATELTETEEDDSYDSIVGDWNASGMTLEEASAVIMASNSDITQVDSYVESIDITIEDDLTGYLDQNIEISFMQDFDGTVSEVFDSTEQTGTISVTDYEDGSYKLDFDVTYVQTLTCEEQGLDQTNERDSAFSFDCVVDGDTSTCTSGTQELVFTRQ